MATRAGLVTVPERGVSIATWSGLTNATSDVGSAVSMAARADKTVQTVGTFGVGGEVTLEGSNDGVTWGTLTDPLGTSIVMTTSAPVVVAQNPRYIRPNTTAGDGATSLTVIVVGRA